MKRIIKNLLICLRWVITKILEALVRLKMVGDEKIDAKRREGRLQATAEQQSEYQRELKEMEEMEKMMERAE
jgi:hypothetical protein